jgi:hypothetical protein
MNKDQLEAWAKKEIKPKYKIEKSEPLVDMLRLVCDAARDHGEISQWLLESSLLSVCREYGRK